MEAMGYMKKNEFIIGEFNKYTFCIIKDKEGKILHHYIYAKRKSDNQIGIYDLVSGTNKRIDFDLENYIYYDDKCFIKL